MPYTALVPQRPISNMPHDPPYFGWKALGTNEKSWVEKVWVGGEKVWAGNEVRWTVVVVCKVEKVVVCTGSVVCCEGNTNGWVEGEKDTTTPLRVGGGKGLVGDREEGKGDLKLPCTEKPLATIIVPPATMVAYDLTAEALKRVHPYSQAPIATAYLQYAC